MNDKQAETTINAYLIVCAMGIALTLYAIVCSDEYKTQIDQEKHYCEMVKQGVYPAYNENIKCEEVKK